MCNEVQLNAAYKMTRLKYNHLLQHRTVANVTYNSERPATRIL